MEFCNATERNAFVDNNESLELGNVTPNYTGTGTNDSQLTMKEKASTYLMYKVSTNRFTR